MSVHKHWLVRALCRIQMLPVTHWFGGHVDVHTHTRTHKHTHAHTNTYTHTHTHTNTHIHTHINIHTYTYTYTHKHTHTHKQTHKHTHASWDLLYDLQWSSHYWHLFCSSFCYLSTTSPPILLPVHNTFYLSKWRMDGFLYKAMIPLCVGITIQRT